MSPLTIVASLLLFAPFAAGWVLPNPLIGGYANTCDDKVLAAARQGVNVIYWFSINMFPTSYPQGGPNLTCVAEVASTLKSEGLETIHMITVGGWDAPHPIGGTGEQFYQQFKEWNEQVVARPGFESGFMGWDVDLEGNDNQTSPWNSMTQETLDAMGVFGTLAKLDGYIVTLVPPESYFDVSTSLFSTSLTLPYPEWHSDFLYHGHNSYAYIFNRYPIWDAVTIQLYETYSHAGYNISVLQQRPSDYLQKWVSALAAGWVVDFSSVPELNYSSQVVTLPPPQLVIGLANGWAGGAGGGGPRAVLIMPEEVGVAYNSLLAAGGETATFRGATYWCISEEGDIPPAQSTPLYLAAGLNEFLHTRAV